MRLFHVNFDKFLNDSFNYFWVRKNKLKYSEIVSPENFLDRVDSVQHANAFQVVWLLNLRRTIRFLQKQLDIRRALFIDLGCGTGISTLYASRWPFLQLVGVDFQKDLVIKANENLCVWPGKRRFDFLVSDVSVWNIPSFSGPIVLFLFNPFTEPVFRDFLDRNLNVLRENCFIILINDKLRESILDNYQSELLYRDNSRKISVISL